MPVGECRKTCVRQASDNPYETRPRESEPGRASISCLWGLKARECAVDSQLGYLQAGLQKLRG